MDELEKVIRRIECILNENEMDDGFYLPVLDTVEALADALSLLKAQEPVKPYIDYDGQDVWRCGSCGATLFHLSHTQADENEQNCVKFCRYCGKAVKWDG